MRGAVHLPLCPNVNTRERQLLICLPAKLISTFYVGEGRQGGYVQSVVVCAVFSRTTARVTVGVQGDTRTLNSSTISSILPPPHLHGSSVVLPSKNDIPDIRHLSMLMKHVLTRNAALPGNWRLA